jgi:hypothetical protein
VKAGVRLKSPETIGSDSDVIIGDTLFAHTVVDGGDKGRFGGEIFVSGRRRRHTRLSL